MATQSEVNLKGIADNKKFADTNDPNYRFVNFFNLKESRANTIGAINDTKKINFTTSMSIPGNQNAESCRLNATALYNQINTIDYSSSSNYKKGFLERTTVSGRMDQEGLINVDFFLDESAETTDYDLKMLTPVETTSDYPMSIELFGYIVVPVSGNYFLNIKPEFLNSIDIVVAWLQINAESSYRTTNTTFNTKEKQNTPIYLAKGVFIPIRIQMIVTGPIGAFPFTITDKTNMVTDFYSIQGDKKRKQVIFSLTNNPDKSQSCNIYTEGNVENYGIDKAMWETGKETRNVEIKDVKQWPLDKTVDSVGLDEIGNLVAFSNNVKVGTPIIASNYSAINKNATSSAYQMILRENTADIIRLIRINRFLNKPDTTTTSSSRISGSVTGLLSNRGWNNYNRNILNDLDRITMSDPLVSTNKRFMLALVETKDSNSIVLSKSLVLKASTSSATMFYELNVDNKLGKSFYANKNVAKEYLREVPSDLTAYSSTSTYASYGNYYPQPNGIYKTGSTNDCRKECNTDPTCTHVYNVTDAEGVKCLLSSGQPVYSIKPSDSPYTASTLHVRGKTLDINQMKDKSFQNVKYEMGSVTGFNNYTLKLPLTKDSIAFTKGEDEFILLQNKISASSSKNFPLVRRDPKNKSAGIIQGFSGLFSSNLEGFQYRQAPNPLPPNSDVIQNISGQLIGLKGQIVDYTGLQTRVGNLARDISGNIDNINTQYTTLSGNNAKYDFSGDSVNVLDEDYGITPALLKDNAIYLEEQTNLNIIGTITLATLLISAIFVSR